MRQTRGRNTDPDVRDQILALAAQGWRAPRIIDLLEAEERFMGRVPAERTVRHLLSQADVEPVADAPWTFADAPPGEAAVVLPMLAALRQREVPWLNRDVVGWMVRIQRAMPGIEAGTALLLAARYLLAERGGRPTTALDEELVRLSGSGAR